MYKGARGIKEKPDNFEVLHIHIKLISPVNMFRGLAKMISRQERVEDFLVINIT